MSDKNYNGWTNYATWRVNLEAIDGIDLRDHFDELPDAYDAGQWAKGVVESLVYESSASLTRDWALAFISDVDWYSIGRHLIENASEVDA